MLGWSGSQADSWESKALSHRVPPLSPSCVTSLPVSASLLPQKEDDNRFYLMLAFKWP